LKKNIGTHEGPKSIQKNDEYMKAHRENNDEYMARWDRTPHS